MINGILMMDGEIPQPGEEKAAAAVMVPAWMRGAQAENTGMSPDEPLLCRFVAAARIARMPHTNQKEGQTTEHRAGFYTPSKNKMTFVLLT